MLMNRTDQKYALNEIIVTMEEVIAELKNHTTYYMMRVEDFKKLYDNLEENGYSNTFNITVDEFNYELAKEIYRNTSFDNLIELVETFSSDIDDLMDNVSEARQDKLQERYGDLEIISDSISYENIDSEVSEMIDTLEEKLIWIAGMLK